MKLKILISLLIITTVLFSGCINQEEEGGEEMADLTGKSILMIIAPYNFRDEELLRPKEIFENSNAQVTIASKDVTTAKGMLGATVDVDKDISDINVADYDAIIFVGGTGASQYFDDSTAQSIAKDAYNQGKLVGAICIAPSILANAGILEGKRATAFSSEADNLRNKGAEYTGEAVTHDGKIITGIGPEAAADFGRTIVENLK